MSIIKKEIERTNTPSHMRDAREKFGKSVAERAKHITPETIAKISKKNKPDYESSQHEHSLVVASWAKTFGKDKVPQMPVKEREEYFKGLIVRLREEKEEVASL